MRRVMEELRRLTINEVELGYAGIQLFTPGQLRDGQAGYSIDTEGRSLTGTEEGDWQPAWIVIGIETCCGDPIIVDTADGKLPVYTAPHGTGSWEIDLIAISMEKFEECLKLLAKVARGRENPVALENNPLTDDDKETVLNQIVNLNPGIDGAFWAAFLEG